VPSEDRGAGALHLAASFGDVDIVNLLLDAGADMEARDLVGQTPLLLGASASNLKVVEFLLDRGPDVEASQARLDREKMLLE
jgi:uncharacterized protein